MVRSTSIGEIEAKICPRRQKGSLRCWNGVPDASLITEFIVARVPWTGDIPTRQHETRGHPGHPQARRFSHDPRLENQRRIRSCGSETQARLEGPSLLAVLQAPKTSLEPRSPALWAAVYRLSCGSDSGDPGAPADRRRRPCRSASSRDSAESNNPVHSATKSTSLAAISGDPRPPPEVLTRAKQLVFRTIT